MNRVKPLLDDLEAIPALLYVPPDCAEFLQALAQIHTLDDLESRLAGLVLSEVADASVLNRLEKIPPSARHVGDPESTLSTALDIFL